MYKLHYGTQAAYDAKLAAQTLIEDDLYFTSDTCLIYKGSKQLSAAVEAVDEFPATGAQGRIYVKAETLEAKVWNGSAWVEVSPAVETELTADTAAGVLVTAGAIRSYVTAQTGTGSLVKDVAYDSATQKFTLTYADDSTKEMPLKDLITGVSYDAATGDFTFSKANGEAVVVNTPVENFLEQASYDADTHILTLTMAEGEAVTVNLEELIDIVTVESTDSVELAINANNITANVKISAEEGNVLELKTGDNAGLFISLADYTTTEALNALLAEKADKSALEALEDRVDTLAASDAVDKLAERVTANEEAIAKNAEDIAKNAQDIADNKAAAEEAIAKNAEDIAKNAEDIAKNAQDIADNKAAAEEAIAANTAKFDDYYTKAEVDAMFTWQEI